MKGFFSFYYFFFHNPKLLILVWSAIMSCQLQLAACPQVGCALFVRAVETKQHRQMKKRNDSSETCRLHWRLWQLSVSAKEKWLFLLLFSLWVASQQWICLNPWHLLYFYTEIHYRKLFCQHIIPKRMTELLLCIKVLSLFLLLMCQ